MRTILLLLLVFQSCCDCAGQIPATLGPSPEWRYERFCSPPSPSSVESLVLTAVQDEKCTHLLGIRVNQSGELKRYSVHEPELEEYPLGRSIYRGAKGVIGTLEDDENTRVQELQKVLPVAPEEVPPMNRRLAVHSRKGDAWTTQVYDRSVLPVDIIELLKLTRAEEDMGAWVLSLRPNDIRQVGSSSRRGNFRRFTQLTISNDGEEFVWAHEPDGVQVFNTSSGERTHTLRDEGAGPCVFSPDKKFFVIQYKNDRDAIVVFDAQSWSRIAEIRASEGDDIGLFQFLPESRFLVQVGLRLALYGTADWKEQPLPSGLPENATWCQLSVDGRRAVFSEPDESLWLWDRERNASIAQLDPSCHWTNGSFSPSKTDFAALTRHAATEPNARSQTRLRIWDATTGKLHCELFPYDVSPGPLGRQLVWACDGSYLIGTSYHPMLSGINIFHSRLHVWNVHTGRHRADFLGIENSLIGLGLGPQGSELIAGSDNGNVYRWDLDAALKQIRDFELSLSPDP